MIDKPVKYSELVEKYQTKEEICKALCVRCNELGKMIDSEAQNKEEK